MNLVLSRYLKAKWTAILWNGGETNPPAHKGFLPSEKHMDQLHYERIWSINTMV